MSEAAATQNAAVVTEEVKVDAKAHRAPIETAPKDRRIVVWHPVTNTDVVVEFDTAWGGGRGAFFNDKNHVIAAKEWNPLQTGLYNL